MYLKRLEVFGFKTFAERVELHFSPGITAIVGPNGAGKSNLAEAVLWAFGEQSLKALRSSRAQDVIFSGSREKKPVGLAEVSVTLDDGEGRLGLDFPELTVTRRVYRSGEGEYLLNRIPCRLRDIHDLFLDTGIGRQAYSIINQTQIDAILSVRPEDRRELIEEVAGVGKYRQRKKEALRKLETTGTNLLRVNDIIVELESQLEPLARQSEEAREYSEISRELSSLRLSLLVVDHNSFQTSLRRAREREAELEAELEASRSREAQLAADEVRLRGELAQVEESQEEMRTLAGRLAQEKDRQEGQEAVVREKIRFSERQQQSLEADCRQCEEDLRQAKAQQEQAAASQQEITAKEQEGLAALKEREAALFRVEEEIGRREEGLTAARAEQLELLGRVSERRNVHAQGTALQKAAVARLARLAEEIAAARRELEARAQTEAEKSQELEGLLSTLPETQARLQARQLESEQAGENVRESERKEENLQSQTLTARSRLEALEQLRKEREGLSPGARSLLGEGFSLLSDVLRVPPRFSIAIEAALGPWLEAILCKNEEEALRGRRILREKGGQAAFLPLEQLPASSSESFPANFREQAGFLGRAADLAGFPEEYRSLSEYLLGRTFVVEDLETALRLRKETSGGDLSSEALAKGEWQIITLEGEILFPRGMYLGKEREPAGPLSRQAEIEALRERLSSLEEAMARAREDGEKARAALAAIAAEMTSTQEELKASESRKASLEENLALLRAEIERNRERWAGLEAEARGLREEIGEARKEQTALEEEIRSLEAQQQQTAVEMAAAEAALRSLREERETLSRELEEGRIALASLAGERQALEARSQTLLDLQQSLAGQIQSRRESLRLLEKEREDLESGLVNMETRSQELRQALERAQSDLTAVAEKRQRLLEAIAAKLEEAKAHREQREGIQSSLHRLQLRITSLEGELSFLARNLEEDHRISLEKAREVASPIENRKEAQEKAASLQASLDALGTVNLGAMEEYERVKSRLDFLCGQRQDLEKAREDLKQMIAEIDSTAREKFLECFHSVQKEFDSLFRRLFDGGETELRLTHPGLEGTQRSTLNAQRSTQGEILEAGVDVEVTVPGKRRQNLLLLSGGERALTALALVFALLRVKPTPFVVLDEIDAPLDDSNVGRYTELLKDFARDSQFIIITHNKGTMEAADTLYGVTMEKAGVSTLIGMKLSELPAG